MLQDLDSHGPSKTKVVCVKEMNDSTESVEYDKEEGSPPSSEEKGEIEDSEEGDALQPGPDLDEKDLEDEPKPGDESKEIKDKDSGKGAKEPGDVEQEKSKEKSKKKRADSKQKDKNRAEGDELVDIEKIIKLLKRKMEKKDLDLLEIRLHNTINETKDELGRLHEYIANVENNFQEILEEVRNEGENVATEVNKKLDTTTLGLYQKHLDKLNFKVENLMEDVGFGEALDVSKIPPNILEIVYQFTLDDVTNALWKNLGSHDAEMLIRNTLEELRLRTSGSELFRFDGRYIVAKDLGRAIEKKLVSANQIHTTYDELLDKLLENLPRYKAKNFRAMIKVKSQEYAVDKITHILGEMTSVRENIANINRITVALSSSFASRLKQTEDNVNQKRDAMKSEMDDRIGELNGLINTLRDTKVEVEDYTSLLERINKMEKTVKSLSGDFMKITLERELGKKADKSKEVGTSISRRKLPSLVGDEVSYEKEEKTKKPDKKAEEIASKKEKEKKAVEEKLEKKKGPEIKEEEAPAEKRPKPKHIVLGDDDVPEEVSEAIEEVPEEKESGLREEETPIPTLEEEKFAVSQEKLFDLLMDAGEKGVALTPLAKALGAAKKAQKDTLKEVLGELVGAMAAEEFKRGKSTYYRLPVETKRDKKQEPEKAGKKEKKEEKPDKTKGKSKSQSKVKRKSAKKDSKKPDKKKKGKKKAKDLDEKERQVYEAINSGKNGISLTKLKKGVDVKYTELLDCLNVLLDSELVSIKTKGRTTLYYRTDKNNIGGE